MASAGEHPRASPSTMSSTRPPTEERSLARAADWLRLARLLLSVLLLALALWRALCAA